MVDNYLCLSPEESENMITTIVKKKKKKRVAKAAAVHYMSPREGVCINNSSRGCPKKGCPMSVSTFLAQTKGPFTFQPRRGGCFFVLFFLHRENDFYTVYK